MMTERISRKSFGLCLALLLRVHAPVSAAPRLARQLVLSTASPSTHRLRRSTVAASAPPSSTATALAAPCLLS